MRTITHIHHEKSVGVDRLCDALLIPRATYYRHERQRPLTTPRFITAKKQPKNALNEEEKQQIFALLHSERFIDKTPYVLFNTLLDEGLYHCSPRTMYRLLEAQGENKERRPLKHHRDAVKPELIATRSNEVWSWDITKLRTTQKWVYLYLYVILDIFSRYVVGWMIAEGESKELARRLIHESALKQGIQPHQLTLHADNGPSMTSGTVAQLLDHLGITKTHNRPYVSDDNPFSESQFKTLKYCPEFPGQFKDLTTGEIFSRQFFSWYNKQHYHSSLAWLTPESVHYGSAEEILEKRYQSLLQAYLKNPLRFNHKVPMKKELPKAVYINPPKIIQIASLQHEAVMA